MTHRICPLVVSCALAAALLGGSAIGATLPQQPPPQQQNEFVPVDELRQEEQLPAAPLLIAAYAVAWLVTLGYLWSIWRRLQKVDRELDEVSRRLAERVRS